MILFKVKKWLKMGITGMKVLVYYEIVQGLPQEKMVKNEKNIKIELKFCQIHIKELF